MFFRQQDINSSSSRGRTIVGLLIAFNFFKTFGVTETMSCEALLRPTIGLINLFMLHVKALHAVVCIVCHFA